MNKFKKLLTTLGLVVALPLYALAATQNGSNNVAAAGLLTGSTLNSTVTASSLTSVGTLTNLTVTNPISGSVTGNAATATALQTGRAIGGVTFDGAAAITPTQIQPASEGSDTTNFLTFFNAASGTAQQPKYNASLGYNASTNAVSATTFIGALTGNADTVTTNANLTGVITSSGNATSIASQTGTGTTFVVSASPTLTGSPLAPTQSVGDNSTKLATTAYVDRAATVIQQNSQSTGYTLVLADQGKQILHPSADTTARTFTIPANSSVAYPIGTVLTFVNEASAGILTIAITTDTMYLAGSVSSTGSRTLTAVGVATAIKVTATEWIISGAGLT